MGHLTEDLAGISVKDTLVPVAVTIYPDTYFLFHFFQDINSEL